MDTEIRSARPHKQRQAITVATGWAGVALGIMLFAATIGHARSGLMPSVGVAIACLAYCVLARPFIAGTSHGIVISNVIREVALPWGGISHAVSRGSLVVHDTEGHKVTVWAVGSRKARSSKLSWAAPSAGTASVDSGDDAPVLVLPANSPQAMRDAINAEVMDNPDGPSGRVVRWLPLPCLLMSVAVVALVVGVLR